VADRAQVADAVSKPLRQLTPALYPNSCGFAPARRADHVAADGRLAITTALVGALVLAVSLFGGPGC